MAGYLSAFAPPRPQALLRSARRPLAFPLEDPRCRLYRWGRHALWHGLIRFPLSPGDEVLTPAYHHGVEVGTLLERGLRPVFYEATADLEPDTAELEQLVGERTRALYLIHTLGFPLDAARWRRWCDDRGLLLIEDVAQAWLAEADGRPLGSWGDLAFWSPWKTLGLPDCGVLLCASPPAFTPSSAQVEWRSHLKGTAKWLAGRWGGLSALRQGGGRTGFDATAAFAVGEPDVGVSRGSLLMLRRMDTRGVAATRRANNRRMLELIGDLVPRPFDRLTEGTCPLFVPVESHDKLGLLRHLAERRIAAVDFWAVPHPALQPERFPAAAARRERTVALPVHQELGGDDLERIAIAVREFGAVERHGPVDIGDSAPDFELRDQSGTRVVLSAHRGSAVVLYFYPEADTPGCTTQACGLRDRPPSMAGLDATVLGVSPDDPAKLRGFAERHQLGFTLLSDPAHEIAERYGVWKRAPGLVPRWENERTTFLIDPDGRVAKVLRAVDPALHDGLVGAELSRLAARS